MPRGHEPLAMLGGTIRTDFEGDQWTFFKPAPQDLERLFGIDIHEMQLYRPLPEQIEEQLRAGPHRDRRARLVVPARHPVDRLPARARQELGRDRGDRRRRRASALLPQRRPVRALAATTSAAACGSTTATTTDIAAAVHRRSCASTQVSALARRRAEGASQVVLREHFAYRPGSNPFVRFGDSLADASAEPARGRSRRLPHLRLRDRADGRIGVRSCASHVEWLFGDARRRRRRRRSRRSPAAQRRCRSSWRAGAQFDVEPACATARRRLGRRDRRSVDAPRSDAWPSASSRGRWRRRRREPSRRTAGASTSSTGAPLSLPLRGSDDDDHWFRHELDATGASAVVQFGGLATRQRRLPRRRASCCGASRCSLAHADRVGREPTSWSSARVHSTRS